MTCVILVGWKQGTALLCPYQTTILILVGRKLGVACYAPTRRTEIRLTVY